MLSQGSIRAQPWSLLQVCLWVPYSSLGSQDIDPANLELTQKDKVGGAHASRCMVHLCHSRRGGAGVQAVGAKAGSRQTERVARTALGLNTRPQQSSWAWYRAPVLLRIVYMAQLIKKSQTCLPLFSTITSWLHSQEALKLGLQADGTSAHWQQAAPSWGERTESLTGEPWSQREKRPQRPLIPGVLKLCCVSASPLEMAESLRNTQVKLMHPEVIWFPGSQH